MSITGPEATFAAVLAPFAAAAIAPFATRLLGANAAWPLAVVPAAIFLFFAGLVPEVAGGASFTPAVDWVPAYGVSFSFYVDGLSTLFALLISGIGTFIILYAGGYLRAIRIRAASSPSCSCSWARCSAWCSATT